MHYTAEQLKQIQKSLCMILENIQRVCKEKEIEYFVIGGTALGAQRHNGFIPWDDDIDIGMTRENYEKFLALPPDSIGENFTIASRKNEKNCPFPYAKVRLKGTEFIEYANYGIKNISTGLYVDIFPYDKIPENKELYSEQFEKTQKLILKYVFKKQKNLTYEPKKAIEKIKAIIKAILYYFFKLIPDGIILNRLYKEMTRYNNTDSKQYSCLFFPEMYVEYAEEKTLFPLQDYTFEQLMVKGPNDMDAYLTSHYGNYNELPPEDKRVSHRPYKVKI